MSDVGLTHIALAVRSLGASAAFYGRYANMRVVHRRHGVIWLADGTRPFAVVLIESGTVQPVVPPAHLGVGVPARGDVDRLCALARVDNCLLREPEDAGPPVGYWALLRDPDGHTLEIAHGQDVGLAVAAAASP